MPTFSLISPLDQPTGKRRLLGDLKALLADKTLSAFGFSVAFAKVGPLYRLQRSLEAWKAAGKKSQAIFGIDHNGTSLQALEFALLHMDEVYYTQYGGHSFHPKLYWFKGSAKGVAIIGSNNMTVGGTELNFEAAVELVFTLPSEAADFSQVYAAYSSLLPASCVATHRLTPTNLAKLHADGLLLDETVKVGTGGSSRRRVAHPGGPKLPVQPASSLPTHVFRQGTSKAPKPAKKAIAAKVTAKKPFVPVSGFAIQINPHPNGEIFLSKIAAGQNPAFFGMPFTGKTTPKFAGNPSYPERSPDPICNIVVYGTANKIVCDLPKYPLNTVFYETKSEIRVTASPLVAHVPPYSVLVMYPSAHLGVDYEMQIFTPHSPDYANWEKVCNQVMPSGGKKPRKFGWF